jgi:hypothetical protein
MSIHNSRRKVFMGVLAVTLPLTSVAFLVSPAGATPKAPFSGNATGTVTCTLPKLKVSFSPPLTSAGTGSDTITIKGTFKSCTDAGGNVSITSGKVLSGTFSSTGGCNGLLAGTTSPVNLTISWKGKSLAGGKATINNSVVSINGAAPAFSSGGDVGFELPNPASSSPGSVSGSLAGPVVHHSFAYSTTSAATAGDECSPTTSGSGKVKPAKGIKKLSVKSGTITIP